MAAASGGGLPQRQTHSTQTTGERSEHSGRMYPLALLRASATAPTATHRRAAAGARAAASGGGRPQQQTHSTQTTGERSEHSGRMSPLALLRASATAHTATHLYAAARAIAPESGRCMREQQTHSTQTTGERSEHSGRMSPLALLRASATAHTATCLLYTSPSPRDRQKSRMPSSA